MECNDTKEYALRKAQLLVKTPITSLAGINTSSPTIADKKKHVWNLLADIIIFKHRDSATLSAMLQQNIQFTCISRWIFEQGHEGSRVNAPAVGVWPWDRPQCKWLGRSVDCISAYPFSCKTPTHRMHRQTKSLQDLMLTGARRHVLWCWRYFVFNVLKRLLNRCLDSFEILLLSKNFINITDGKNYKCIGCLEKATVGYRCINITIYFNKLA